MRTIGGSLPSAHSDGVPGGGALHRGQGVVEQQAGHSDDGVHRCSDLVAHVGEELAFSTGRRLGSMFRSAQSDLDRLALGDVEGVLDDLKHPPCFVKDRVHVDLHQARTARHAGTNLLDDDRLTRRDDLLHWTAVGVRRTRHIRSGGQRVAGLSPDSPALERCFDRRISFLAVR